MSRFADAIAFAEQNPGLTINDLLTELGYQDPGSRINLTVLIHEGRKIGRRV